MNKIVIIGANTFQDQLIRKSKELGYETHVFAWEEGAVGKLSADFFYPISIVEKERILEECKKIRPIGICSIASDLAVITVNYIASKLGLNSNSVTCSLISTNKFLMREELKKNLDPIPKYLLIGPDEKIDLSDFIFPIIVKPVDRSGSRGITKVEMLDQVRNAINVACNESFLKKAMIEEFMQGKEYSVECISYHGQHTLLAITEKETTGSPHFIETGHIQPAQLSSNIQKGIQGIVYHALNSLNITDGASHSEIMINGDDIKIVEIGSRMGGDCIGSDLVQISTGYDFLKMVIDVACNNPPDFTKVNEQSKVFIKFLFDDKDLKYCQSLLNDKRYSLIRSFIEKDIGAKAVTDSSNRYGYFIFKEK